MIKQKIQKQKNKTLDYGENNREIKYETSADDDILRQTIQINGQNWKIIAEYLEDRNVRETTQTSQSKLILFSIFAIIISQITYFKQINKIRSVKCKQFSLFAFTNEIKKIIRCFYSFFVELMLPVALAYIKGLNTVFGTRDIIFVHYGIGAIPYALLGLIWQEARKYMICNGQKQGSLLSWRERCVAFRE